METVHGLDTLLARMKALPKELVSKNGGVASKALKAGAKLIREQAKENVRRIVAEPNVGGLDSKSTGALEKNIIMTRSARPRAIDPLSSEVWRVRIKRNAKRYANTKANRRTGAVGKTYFNEISYYARFLEFGTKRGIKPYAWLRNAASSKQAEAFAVMVRTLLDGVAEAERKVKAIK